MPFQIGRCWLPSRSIFEERTRASINMTSHHHRRGGITQIILNHTSSSSTRTPQPQEAILPLVLFIISPRGNPPPPHWSRVLHHNGGPNQYKSCVFVLQVRGVHLRDLSELGRGLIGRRPSCAPSVRTLRVLPESDIRQSLQILDLLVSML